MCVDPAFQGKAKAIGVSNFSIKTLSILLQHAEIVPAVNQVEMHPSLPQHELLDFCRARGVALTAYTPLGKHKLANDPVIQQVATAHGASGAQVLLSWGVQRGTSVIPKTVNEQRMRENLDVSAPLVYSAYRNVNTGEYRMDDFAADRADDRRHTYARRVSQIARKAPKHVRLSLGSTGRVLLWMDV